LTRSDGQLIALHPSYSNNKVECKYGLPGTDDQVPAAGPGGSDGQGTYKHFKSKYVDTILKFDGEKNKEAKATRDKCKGGGGGGKFDVDECGGKGKGGGVGKDGGKGRTT
jgi:hypothetical protein